MLRVTAVKYIDDYRLWLRFDDGTEGTINLLEHFNGPMFEPLKDIKFFMQVVLDPELGTIVWPNGVDLAPEFLKKNLN
jgi:hypothetical protein